MPVNTWRWVKLTDWSTPMRPSTRDRLLNTAVNLLYARSYADVGVQELCKRARIKKGSFYHFFDSKQQLTLAALDRQWNELKQSIFTNDPASRSPVKRIEHCFTRFYYLHSEMKERTGNVLGCPFGNLAMELSTQDETIRKKVDTIFQEVEGYFEQILNDAIAAGEVPQQNTRVTAQALLAYLEGLNMVAKVRNDPEVIKRLASGMVRSLIGARTEVPRRTLMAS